ncbi:aminopeptidase M1 [Selaginella moellendorffii]|uniref:aminopeptidase M1 n=1 Tax=Selaginella moellendorffii TaxID=88036 RepID=UPI000D1C9765|nr:aminopeptidase M1 [Selaginella moellendorffii]|eukprot:XP_024523589.1 aminopeptidase M1 [Selaginella moellendorffii]
MASSRLPKTVLPRRYELELWVDLDACAFKGKLQILLDIVEPVSKVVLNVADLILETESLCLRYVEDFDEIVHPAASTVDQENELLVLNFGEKKLHVGKATLFIDYHGLLNEKLDAFYRSTYKSGGVEKNMAVTVFEPADARRCFPCWDEPDFKACFKFKVHVPVDLFLDDALLVDENTTTLKKQEVAINVAHEVGHMWFGNLVTLEWWTHIWLNEGMATWISYMAVDYLFPDWNIWMEFHKEIMYDAFKLDALESTHPVEMEVQHARQTMEVFDVIGYCKGASLIYMLQDYVGLTDIQRGLQLYMEKFAFSNAKSDDLWDCIQEVTGKPIKDLMCSWTKLNGYPILKATMLNDHELEIEQTRFLASGQPAEGQWIVPVKLISGSYNCQQSILLKDRKCIVRLPARTVVKLNIGQSGFYRVEYDEQLLTALKDSISSGWLSPVDRLGVLDDMFALCQSTRQPLSALLSLLEVYRQEDDPTVLSHMITVALSLLDVVSVAIPSSKERVSNFLVGLMENATSKLSWEAVQGESHLNSGLREELLHALVVLGHEKTILEAKRRFKNKAMVPLASNMLKAAYASVMKDCNRYGFDELLEIYKSSDKLEERNLALSTLAGSSDPVLVVEALNFSLSPAVRPQNVTDIFSGLTITNGITAWNWLKENWGPVHAKLGEGFLLRRLVDRVASKLWTSDIVDDVKETISSRISFFRKFSGRCSEKVKLMALWVEAIRRQDSTPTPTQSL